METGIVKYINDTFAVKIPEHTTQEQLEILLAEKINQLIINDFSALITILYRIDVSEKKLRSLLKENNTANAGRIIAALIIDRQIQKIRSRQQSSRDQNNIIDEDERW